MTTGADEAFRTNRALPLGKWIRLDCYVQDSEVGTQLGASLLPGALIGSILNNGFFPDGKLDCDLQDVVQFRIVSTRVVFFFMRYYV